jgi:hypothetical protein
MHADSALYFGSVYKDWDDISKLEIKKVRRGVSGEQGSTSMRNMTIHGTSIRTKPRVELSVQNPSPYNLKLTKQQINKNKHT